MLTLSELRKLKTIKAIRKISECNTIEDIPKMRENIKKSILEIEGNNLRDFSENEYHFIFKNKYWHKPKVKKIQEGILEFRSKDYVFIFDGKKHYGTNLKADMLTNYGFKMKSFTGGVFEYHFLNNQ